MQEARNYSFDKLKFFAIILVILIHTSSYLFYQGHPTFNNYFAYRGFLNVAVPIFFVLSGYFLAKRSTGHIKKYIRKMIYIFVISTIFFIAFNLIISIVTSLMNGTDIILGLKSVVKLLTYNNLLTGSLGSYHLWYLSASAIACGLIYFLIYKKINAASIFAISLVFYVLSFSDILKVEFLVKSGGVASAFLFMSLGMYLATKVTPEKVGMRKKNLALFLISIAVYVILVWTALPAVISGLLLAPAVYYLALFVLGYNSKKPGRLSTLGGYSLYIYIFHPVFITILYKVVYPLMGVGEFAYSLKMTILSTVIVLLLSVLISPAADKAWKMIQKKYL